MDFQDKNLACRDCGNEFVWSAGEQKFFADKGLQNPPSRCLECRRQVKDKKANQPKFTITCKDCGKEGEVPFEPRDPKDVLCRECFEKSRNGENIKTDESVQA